MDISMAATVGENNTILFLKAGEDERIEVGQTITIELTDGSYTERKIVSMENVDYIENGQSTEALIENIKSNTIQTTSMPSRETREKWAKMICLTPYKELYGGKESILDHVSDGYTVPDKVIAYLRTTKPFLMSPGIYDHPFKENTRLLGPYLYTDGKYYWDRDTWKYVVKYGLELPEDFIDHVMSDEGTKFIEEWIESNDSWSKVIRDWKKRKGFVCLLPNDARDTELKDF